MSDKVHAGLWMDCKNCNTDWKPKKRDRREKRTPVFTVDISVENSVRRQVAAELGDVEPSKEHKYAMLQKYGVVAAKIDRVINKPIWNEEGANVWNNRTFQWGKLTKGLVPAQQVKRDPQRYPYRGNPALDKGKYFGPKGSNSSRTSRPSYNRTRTETPQQ